MKPPRTQVPKRYSLRWRLPIQIAALVAVVLMAFLWAAYHRVETALVQTAGARAQRAADQIASLLDGRSLLEQLTGIGARPEIRTVLTAPTPEARLRAQTLFEQFRGASPRRFEIWDASGALQLEVGIPGGAPHRSSPELLPPAEAPSEPGISSLQAGNDIVYVDLVVPIPPQAGAPARPIGLLRLRSALVENPPGIFARLVGDDVQVRVGDRTGGHWTDFQALTPAAVDLSQPGVRQYRSADGQMHIGAVALIPETPLAAWVDFPFAAAVAPAQTFLRRMLGIAALFVAAAGLLAAVLAGRITTPLNEIRDAAAALAGGDYDHRVTVRRRDEIGQLKQVFNTMAAAIQRSSAALHRSEDNYHRLFASNPHPMWLFDAETLRILDVNDTAIDFYGYSRDEFLSMSVTDLRPPEQVPALLAHLANPSPGTLQGIWKHRKKDGTLVDVEINWHDLEIDGRPARVILANDVTASLRAQQALREREALFRSMAETMPHIVWTLGADGTLEYVNRQWQEYAGLDFETTARVGWHAVLHPEDEAAGLVQRWTDAIRDGRPYECSCRLRRHEDGAYRWHLVRWSPLRHDTGEIALWVGTSTDIDDSRRTEEALRALNAELEARVQARTAELEDVNRELESFSYSVSHDLRAPLRHVQGYVELLTASLDGQLAERPRRYLQTITDATVEMGQLIDDLLTLARISRTPMSEERVSLDSLVRAVIERLETTVSGRHIIWQVHPLPEVIGDASLIRQVFVNLLDNAVKYTRRRDPATIEIGCSGKADGRVTLFVRDNGAGFDMQYVHKLFGVFQRLHRSDEFEGTGVGLATVHRIVTRHQGRTWAEGRVDEGATFYFTLAAAGEAAADGGA
ncbi:MAG TPA: PAS domain S-box protein [Vicinamibacterales bacterium]